MRELRNPTLRDCGGGRRWWHPPEPLRTVSSMRMTPVPEAAQGSLLRHAHGEEPEAPLRVLSIDGGGVRGLVPAIVLAEIERRAGRPVSKLFDVVAGTSTGAILAVAMTVPGEEAPGPRWSAQDCVDIYREHVVEVFGRSGWQVLPGASLVREKYDEAPLEHLMEHYYGDTLFSQALAEVVVPAYDLANNDVMLFDSAAAAGDPALDLPMRVVVRGATAAPTYFEPQPVGPPLARREHLLVDGGIFANNPGICAFMQAQRRHLGADLVMVSLGTGGGVRDLHMAEVKSWGLAHWARPLFNLVLESVSQATDHYLLSLLGPQRYFRLTPDLETNGCSHRLDDVSPENIEGLVSAASGLVKERSQMIDAVCELLVS